MSKSIKFKNNTYWDSTSITHNKELLSTKVINSSGSNSNGNWIKFEDGTMICSFTQTIKLNVTSSWGSLYMDTFTVHNYPQEFIDVPNTSVTLLTDVWGGWLGINGDSGDTMPSKTNVGTLAILRPTAAYYAVYKVNVIAIGKWK